jgi:hypothetical protein
MVGRHILALYNVIFDGVPGEQLMGWQKGSETTLAELEAAAVAFESEQRLLTQQPGTQPTDLVGTT